MQSISEAFHSEVENSFEILLTPSKGDLVLNAGTIYNATFTTPFVEVRTGPVDFGTGVSIVDSLTITNTGRVHNFGPIYFPGAKLYYSCNTTCYRGAEWFPDGYSITFPG